VSIFGRHSKRPYSRASNILPSLRERRSQDRHQIVGGLMINCALGPAEMPHPYEHGAWGIKLQFVICNSECRLIYSRRSHLPFARSDGAEGLEIKRRLMRKREGARRKGASVILFGTNKRWLSAHFRYFYRTLQKLNELTRCFEAKSLPFDCLRNDFNLSAVVFPFSLSLETISIEELT